MKPSPKSPSLEQYLNSLTGVSRVGAITEESCVSCHEMAKSFRDDLSRKEFSISGLCQTCQDEVFGTEEPV